MSGSQPAANPTVASEFNIRIEQLHDFEFRVRFDKEGLSRIPIAAPSGEIVPESVPAWSVACAPAVETSTRSVSRRMRSHTKRSGWPLALCGAGAERFGDPSGSRGMPAVGCLYHCCAARVPPASAIPRDMHLRDRPSNAIPKDLSVASVSEPSARF